jgi:D-serine deaminase-like pyridoxal phosphate-dependent protein
MKGTAFLKLDTPALLVDLDRMEHNLRFMQEKAALAGVRLRPHTKTHRTPAIAKIQEAMGATGITVAKLGEAEIMASEGLDDIFIANEIVGPIKLERLKRLMKRVRRLAVGVDHPVHVEMLSRAMEGEPFFLDVLIDVETGDPRTGISPGGATLELARRVAGAPGLRLRGIYTHDGQSYDAETIEEVRAINRQSQKRLLETADLLRRSGIPVEEISVGSTPSLLVDGIEQGITEIRPGTYVFLDADQAQLIGTTAYCAQTVLVTVISRPTPERVVLDAGTKSLTYYVQDKGVTRASGHGRLKDYPDVFLDRMSDEHSSFDIPVNSGLAFSIGDKIEIIPNHACPTTNLHEFIHGVRNGRIEVTWPVLCRGKSQ